MLLNHVLVQVQRVALDLRVTRARQVFRAPRAAQASLDSLVSPEIEAHLEQLVHLDHKVFKETKAQQAFQDPRVIRDHQDSRESLDQLEPLVSVVCQETQVYKDRKEQLGNQAIREQKVP